MRVQADQDRSNLIETLAFRSACLVRVKRLPRDSNSSENATKKKAAITLTRQNGAFRRTCRAATVRVRTMLRSALQTPDRHQSNPPRKKSPSFAGKTTKHNARNRLFEQNKNWFHPSAKGVESRHLSLAKSVFGSD